MKSYFKEINQLVIVGFVLIVISACSSNTPTEEIPDEVVSQEYLIGQKLISDVYESNENGLKTFLKFEESDGSQGMFGSLTLANNVSDCKYIFTYTISESTIEAVFFNSDCGGHSDDQNFSYDEEQNTISAFIEGQEYVFKSIF